MTKDEQPVDQLDAEIRAIEAADPTETSGAALLRGAKQEIERLQAELAELRETHTDKALAWDKCAELRTELAEARAREGRLRKGIGQVEAHLLDADRHNDPGTLRSLCIRQANQIRHKVLALATPAPVPTSEAERRVVEAAVEVWQRYQSIIQLRPAFDSPFWQEFGNACQALAAQQEPTPDEESGDE